MGFTEDGRAVYDYSLMVDSLCKDEGISEEDAIDFIDSDTLRSIPPNNTVGPIVIYCPTYLATHNVECRID